jgi:hypothetical protein
MATSRNVRYLATGVVVTALATSSIAFGLLASPASAVVIGVSTEAEYRAAVDDINDNQCGTGPHTIEITASFAFSTTGDPTYTCADNLTIEAAFPGHFTIDGTGVPEVRFLDAFASTGNITIDQLDIVGFEYVASGLGAVGEGGAIASGGSVWVIDSTFNNNTVYAAGDSTEVYGGAISAGGDVTVTSSEFSGNSVNTLGAIDSLASGGAIDASGGVWITDSEFESNHIYATGSGSYADGGAVFAGMGADAEGSTFDSNSAEGAESGSGGAIVVGSGTLDVVATTFVDNFAYSLEYADGGAISADDEVYLTDTTFVDNFVNGGTDAALGGAVWGATLVIVETTIFDGNYASSPNGGVAGGGAIASVVSTEVTDSTFSDNQAVASSSTDAIAFGGAIYSEWVAASTSSTFDNNLVHVVATDAAHAVGGAIYADDSAIAYDSTFTSNEVDGTATTIDAAGGALISQDVLLVQSTLAGNETATLGAHVVAIDLRSYGSVYAVGIGPGSNCELLDVAVSDGYNFDDDESCIPTSGTDIGAGVDPMLNALADNGGPTETMDPLPGSPLIDAITDSSCEDVPSSLLGISPPADQRGILRDVGSCDIGAVEALAPVTFTVVTPNGTVTGTVTQAVDVHNVVWTSAASVTPVPPAGLALPYGVFGFDIEVPHDGWSVGVTLDLPAPVNQFWKLQNSAWTHVTSATISGTQITYGLTDGANGDADATVNSLIVDPAGPGIFALFTG